MKIQPEMTKAQRPKSLNICPDGNNHSASRRRSNSETTSVSGDSGVGADHSSLESIALISPRECNNASNETENASDSTLLPSSPTSLASSFTRKRSRRRLSIERFSVDCVSTGTSSTGDSDVTLTDEGESRQERLRQAEELEAPNTKPDKIDDITRTESQPNLRKSAPKNISPKLRKKHDIQVPAADEFVLCKRHGLSSNLFCSSCADDGCKKCMVERHTNHKLHKSITCSDLLNREAAVSKQMDTCLTSAKTVSYRLESFQSTILYGVYNWQQWLRVPIRNVTQIKADFERHLKVLYSICVEGDSELISFKRMVGGLRKLYHNASLIEMHDNANPVRRSLINLNCINIRATQAITNAILSETGGRSILGDIIKTSGMEMLTHTPISVLPWKDSSWEPSPIHKSPPETEAPDIPSPLEEIFCGSRKPSPTINETFTYARPDPITSSSARVHLDNNWPSKQDQEQMDLFDSVSKLFCSGLPVRPEVNEFNCVRSGAPQSVPSTSTRRWNSQTPQRGSSNFAGQFANPSLRRSRSLVALWEEMKHPGPSVPPLVPLPPSQQQQLQAQPRANARGRVFEIGYHIARNYSQIRMPVLKLEGRYADDPAQLCRPWGICCDNNNMIYVADRSNDRIAIFSTDGVFVGAFGIRGDRPGEFNRPAGLAIDFEGRLVVADKDNHRIQVFTTDGEYLFHFGRYGNQHGEFFYPWDVACSSNGHIAVTDTRNHRVQLFTCSGVFIKKYGWENSTLMLRELDSPRGVVFVKNDEVLVTDFNNHRILRINFGGQVVKSQFNKTNNPRAALNRPQGLTVDAEGNVLVCDSKNDRIVVFSSNGDFVGEFGRHGREDGQFDRTVDISVASDGKIAVVDLHHNQVQIF